MKKFIVILASILMMSTISGCWSYHELRDYAIVMGMGIDKGSTENIKVTAQIALASKIKSNSKDGGDGGEAKAYWNIESEGETIFKIFRDFTHQSGRKLYLPHNKIAIFSREIAEEGIRPYLDLLARDPEPRGTIWLLIAKDKAGEVLDVKSKQEKIPSIKIEKLMDDQKYTSETYTANLVKFMKDLMIKSKAPVLSLIEITGDKEKVVSVSGGAVFKSDKLVGELDRKETRGLLWVEGEVKSGIIVIEEPGGEGKIELEISKATSTVKSEVKDGTVKITINIKEQANIGSQTSANDLATSEMIKMLGDVQNSAIKEEIEASIKKAKELNADIFGFGETVHQKHPAEWKQLEDRWDTIFPEIEVEINVDSEIYGAGIVPKPSTPVS